MEISGINGTNKTIVDSSKTKAADDTFEATLKNAVAKNDAKQLRQACQEFEGIFLNMMYKEMKASVQKSGLIPEDSGQQVFEDMLDDQLTKDASQGKGMGLADMLYKQLSKQLKTE
jgi:flagellar protein FlgJ